MIWARKPLSIKSIPWNRKHLLNCYSDLVSWCLDMRSIAICMKGVCNTFFIFFWRFLACMFYSPAWLFFHVVLQCFLNFLVPLGNANDLSREFEKSLRILHKWYISRLALMTGKYSDFESMLCKNACAEMQIAPISCWNVHLCRECYFPGLYHQKSILLMEIIKDLEQIPSPKSMWCDYTYLYKYWQFLVTKKLYEF